MKEKACDNRGNTMAPILNILKYKSFYIGMTFLLISAPFAGGENYYLEKCGTLRIAYSGNLMGTIEPCG